MKYNLRKYIDSSEIMNRVSASLKTYADSNLILFDDYYKVIDLCNSRLGLKLNPTKEILLEIHNSKAELPEDFLLMNIGLLVGEIVYTQNLPTIKSEYYTGECPDLKDTPLLTDKCCDFKLECGLVPKLTCKYEERYIEFKKTIITPLSEKKYATSDCINLNFSKKGFPLMEITDDYILVDDTSEGYIYLQYQAKMNDKNNLPICLDHPIILNYYEQAIKFEILQDLYINKRLEIAQALGLLEKKLILAKNEAISLTRMPEFGEFVSIKNFLVKRFNSQYKVI